jgi:hypothetical protein
MLDCSGVTHVAWRCWRRHPVGCVIHIDKVPQMTVVKDECPVREVWSFMPKYVNVTDPVGRPHINLRSISRRGS